MAISTVSHQIVQSTVVLLSLTVLTNAAPKASLGQLRAKREVVAIEEISPEEAMIRQELSELSNEQLALLANVVENEIEELAQQMDEEREAPEEVELIEVPAEIVEQIIPEPEPIISIVPEEVFEEAILEQAAAEQAEAEATAIAAAQDEAELSQRIAEIASILNERAARNIRII